MTDWIESLLVIAIDVEYLDRHGNTKMAEMQRRWLQHYPNLPYRGAALVQYAESVERVEEVGNLANTT